MGHDLTIYPVFSDRDFCHDKIELDWDEALFDLIAGLNATNFNNGEGLNCYHDSTYSRVRRDNYGDLLNFIAPRELKAITKTEAFKSTYSKNKRVIKFLSSLPAYKLVLYWH